MDKISFASYKFKPSDVIEGLNRYFADTKEKRYLRAPLTIRNGVCFNNPDCVKDIIFTNSFHDWHTKSGHACWKYYLACDVEEVVSVAINWLREEHDIFYTPGMNEPPIKDHDDIDDFCVDDAAKEYEKATRMNRIEELQESRRDLIEALQKRLHDAKRRIVALEEGHAEKSKIIDRQVARIRDLAKSIAEKDASIKGLEADINGLETDIAITNRLVKEQREFITKVAALLETKDPYIEREYAHVIDVLSNIVRYPNRYRWLYTSLKDGMESVLQEAEERED